MRTRQYIAKIQRKIIVSQATSEWLKSKRLVAPGVTDGTMSLVLLTAACINMVSSRLPCVRQYNQPITTENPVTCIKYKGNDCPNLSACWRKKRGKCQQAHKTPSNNVAIGSPNLCDMRGRANPRQPISSPAWTQVEKITATSIIYHASCPNRGHVPVIILYENATSIFIITINPAANKYHFIFTFHLAILPSRFCVWPGMPVRAVSHNATSDGAIVPRNNSTCWTTTNGVKKKV